MNSTLYFAIMMAAFCIAAPLAMTAVITNAEATGGWRFTTLTMAVLAGVATAASIAYVVTS